KPAGDAARDAALPGGEVHPVILDMPQPVVSLLLGPRHDRHSAIGRIDNQRSPFTQLPFERIVDEARAGATPCSVGISRVQSRLVLFVEHFKGCIRVVGPDSLDVGLAIRRSRRSPLRRRPGAVRPGQRRGRMPISLWSQSRAIRNLSPASVTALSAGIRSYFFSAWSR